MMRRKGLLPPESKTSTYWHDYAKELEAELAGHQRAAFVGGVKWATRSIAMSDDEAMRRLSANETACYRWPDDTDEHKALRAAFVDGAGLNATAQCVDARTQEMHDALTKIYDMYASVKTVGARKTAEIARTGLTGKAY